MNAGDTMQVTTTLVGVTCFRCGVLFGLPDWYNKKRREDHESFYCPNGHSQYFAGRSDAEKLQAALDRQKEQTASAYAEVHRERQRKETAQRQAAAARGQVTRIKRKVARGECPCCTKTFADLHAHMAETHPDWTGEAPS